MGVTKIEWTATIDADGTVHPGYTFNPWRGCSKVHAGCTNCYAEREAKRFPLNRGEWGPMGTRVKASDDMWRQPEKWNEAAAAAGVRKRVFCASLADVFEDWGGAISDHKGNQLFTNPDGKVSTKGLGRALSMGELRDELFKLIDATPWLNWMLLTKRPENVRPMWPDYKRRENVWLGTSPCDQATADKYVPELLKLRDLTPVLFLSAEPLLGPIDFGKRLACIDWLIAGGESGPHARPMHPDWVRSIRNQCHDACVPFLFKQWGEWAPYVNEDHYTHCAVGDSGQVHSAVAIMGRHGKKQAGRTLDGCTWDEFPEVRT